MGPCGRRRSGKTALFLGSLKEPRADLHALRSSHTEPKHKPSVGTEPVLRSFNDGFTCTSCIFGVRGSNGCTDQTQSLENDRNVQNPEPAAEESV